MKSMKKLFMLAVLIGASVITVFAQKYEVPKVTEYKLANGLTVILCEDHSLPRINGEVVVRAGSKDEPSDATGLAHYLEHMMFKGTQNMGTIDWEKEKPYYEKVLDLYDQLGKASDKKQRDEIQKQINQASIEEAAYIVPSEYNIILSQIGVDDANANTSADRTVYLSSFPSMQVEKWLIFYNNSLQNPVFRTFQAELETVYEEYNRSQDMSNRRVMAEAMKLVFPKTPYGRQVIGTPEHLKTPSLRKLMEFHQKYYVASNMALVLCGDFDTEKVKPLIDKTFGTLPTKPVPTHNEEKEAPFKGRKEVTLKIAQSESVQMVYRTAPANHTDGDILNICTSLLYNGQTGFLDQLTVDGTFLAAMASNNSFKNEGTAALIAIPNPQAYYKGTVNPANIRSQSDYNTYIRDIERAQIVAMEEGEKKLLEALKKLTDGSFTDQMLDGVKKSMINSYINSLESTKGKCDILSETFGNNEDIKNFVDFPERINAITRDDVVNIAKKYFGKDYMLFLVKRGTQKTEKIEKPQLSPLEFKTTGPSAFAKEFAAIKSPEPIMNFVDFKTGAQKLQLKNGNTFYFSKNPVNDIFSLSIRFDVGTRTIKELDFANLLNNGGAGGFTPQLLKAQMNNYNCNYSISAGDSYVYVNLSGPEKNFKAAANLISQIINSPTLAQNRITSTMSYINMSRQEEKNDVHSLADALNEYVLYGNKSDYLDRISIKAISQMKAEDVIAAFKNACTYSATVFCSGSWASAEQARAFFESSIQLTATPQKGNAPIVRTKATIAENTVYFVNSTNAKQTQLRIFSNGKPYQTSDAPYVEAFNSYFAGGFNGLVMQEIREKRSMAYNPGASYSTPPVPGLEASFNCVMATQDDKTNSAVDVLYGLIRNMPQYPDRMDALKESIIWSSVLKTPSFRAVGTYIDACTRFGYTEDPMKARIPAYEKLTFDDVVKFWSENIKDKPMALIVVGDKSLLNMKDLEKYGKLVEIPVDSLFSVEQ